MPAAPEAAADAIRRRVLRWAFPAPVAAAAFAQDGRTAAWALGDGTVRRAAVAADVAPEAIAAHGGAVLALAAAPGGGFVSGGDDGQVALVGEGGARALFREPRRWVTHLAVHAQGRIVAAAVGKAVVVLDPAGQVQGRFEDHPSTVTGVALNPTGKRLAVAHYNGVSLWWLAARQQTPTRLTWKGSHVALAWAPNGKYLMTAMQENELHGWRIADSASMRMAGLAAKAKSLAWSADSRWLANSGAEVVTCWDFSGKGPMGRPPAEICPGQGALVTVVAIHPKAPIVAAGYADGTLRLGRPGHPRTTALEPVGGGPLTALAWSPSGDQLAVGGEDGAAALLDFAGA
ncbi:MAG: WD40 repeat domain-containing protein [Alphaproteobacteria bacterium]|nr:WD40 repeat domain-containing protein [Alphaproteobacteria bacterium]